MIRERILRGLSCFSQEKSGKLKIKYEFNLKSDLDNSEVDGKCFKTKKLILVNASLSLKGKMVTLGHELIHYLGFKLTNFRASIIVDNILDYTNFLLEKENLKALINHKFGLRSLKKRIKNTIFEYDFIIKNFPLSTIKEILGFKVKNLSQNRLECLEGKPSKPKTKKGRDMKTTEKEVKSKLREVSKASSLSFSKSHENKKAKIKKEVEKMAEIEKKQKNSRIQKKTSKRTTILKAQKRLRKGKSLLTSYKIHRMERRLVLNLNRPCGFELFRKYT